MRYYSPFPVAIPQIWVRSHALLTRPPLTRRCARLACVRPAASVRSEPGSNSQVETPCGVSLTLNLCTSCDREANPGRLCLIVLQYQRHRNPPNSEADTLSSARRLRARYTDVHSSNDPNRPHISSDTRDVKERRDKTRPVRPNLRRARPEIPLNFLSPPNPSRPSRASAPSVPSASVAPRSASAPPVKGVLRFTPKTRKRPHAVAYRTGRRPVSCADALSQKRCHVLGDLQERR